MFAPFYIYPPYKPINQSSSKNIKNKIKSLK